MDAWLEVGRLTFYDTRQTKSLRALCSSIQSVVCYPRRLVTQRLDDVLRMTTAKNRVYEASLLFRVLFPNSYFSCWFLGFRAKHWSDWTYRKWPRPNVGHTPKHLCEVQCHGFGMSFITLIFGTLNGIGKEQSVQLWVLALSINQNKTLAYLLSR